VQAAARAGARLLLNLSASPYHAGKLRERERLFGQRARAHGLAIAYCNLVGGQDELVFDGASLVLDARGRTLARAAQFRDDLLIFDLPVAGPARPGVARAALPAPTSAAQRPLAAVEEVYEALTLGVRDYVQKNGFSTVVLGLSGGVDSALTACVAADALGPVNVMGIVMPSRFSSSGTQEDARRVARALGIEAHEISIEPAFQAYLKTLKPLFGGGEPDVAEQNLQARIRGNLLMAMSNKFGWLVLTTGNKSEMATGYCTLYGDMAGGFAVIKDVPKTLVYALARFRNRRGPGSPIPESVLQRAPTAELAPNQTDQDTLPPYDELDRILKAYVEEDRSQQEILAADRVDPSVVRRVIQMVDRSEYKRRQAPPGIKITPKAFGRDRRIPITNRYRQAG
jgi:NAD+ synthase (glutamine-hydrolysing)